VSTFPVTIARRKYTSAAELAEVIRDRVVGGVLGHPGHAHPSEQFMSLGDAGDAAVHEALLLLVDAPEKVLVEALVHLSYGHEKQAFWEALLARLEGTGPALPEGSEHAVGRHLVDAIAEGPLLDRGIKAYEAHGMADHVLRVRLQTGTTSERIAALAKAAVLGQLDAGLAKRAGRAIARQDGEAVLDGAAALFNADEDVRAAYRAGASRGDGSWTHRDDLTRALRL